MKKPFRLIPLLLALCLAVPWLSPVGAAAAASARAATHTAGSSEEFHRALAAAQDGDTIQVSGSFVVKNPESNNDSLVIDKAVTIQGGGLTLWYAGILLGADVTFKDITLGLGSNVRPAIMANGHTLTLENVQRDPTCRYIHLFCGGQTGATQGDLSNAKQGSHGQIILRGNTNLGLANIYAGSISTDGQNNVFAKPATVTIDETVKGQPIEHIYACGALQTYTSENDWFDYEHEINPPFASPGNFKVSGNVTINLFGTAAKRVSGDTGVGGNLAQVNYKGTDFLNDSLLLSSIGGLTVESGNLAPAAGQLVQNDVSTADRTSEIVPVSGGSCFSSTNNAPLGVAANAVLGLQTLGDVTVGDFTGGGSLVLGRSQKLTVTGTVTETTTVGIGGIFNGHSQTIPTVGSVYINAANSDENSFILAAPAGRPDIELVYQTGGTWKAEEGHKSTNSIVDDFALTSVVFDPNEEGNALWFATLPFTYVRYAPNSAEDPIAFIPLTIKVNGDDTSCTEDNGSYSYTAAGLELAIGGDAGGEELQISTISPDESQVVPLTGSYLIEVTVPAANSGTGRPITRTATLTVKSAEGQDTPIPAPAANTGLAYDGREQVGVPLNDAYELESGDVSATDAGNYTAMVKPATGFTWVDGSTDTKRISWSIGKADNLDRPAALGTAAPAMYNGSDGKITGTTAEMEYSTAENFISPTDCTANETAGLQAGDYYIRYKESGNYKAGPAVMVTVPQGPLTVTSIAISSTNHKTAYQVGEELNVEDLTLTVTLSDGGTHLVPVAAGMVSGFNSAAAASQTLTVTYGGMEATYDITITEASTGGDPGDSGNTGGGGSTGGGTSGGGSVGGGSPSGAGTAADTVKNPDGSTTSTKTDKNSGLVTETTTYPDGSTLTVVTHPDGPVETTIKQADGFTASLQVSQGSARGEVRLPAPKKGPGAVISLPIPALPGNDAELSIHTGASLPVRVEIPIEGGTITTVACFVDRDGTEHIVKTAFVEDGKITLNVPDEAVVRFRDGSKSFEDTGKHWAEDDIRFVTSRELFLGTTDTTFDPDGSMTRAMLTVVLARLDDVDVSGQSAYKDGISWAVDKGISDGRNPGDQVTREQFITMLYRYAGSPTATDAQLPFSDASSVSGYARNAVCWAVENGILNGFGDGSLRPKGSATRAQAASLLTRYVQYLNQQ